MKPALLAVLLVVGYCLRIYTATMGETWDMTDIWAKNALLWQHGGYDAVLDRGEWNNYCRPWWDFLGTLGYIFPPESHAFRMAVSAVISAFDVANGVLLYLAVGLGGAALYLLCPITLVVAGYEAQFDGVVLFFALAGALLIRNRNLWGALLVGISITLKPVFVFLPLWLAVRESTLWRAVTVALLGALPGVLLLLVDHDRINDIYAMVIGGSHRWNMRPLWFLLPQLARDWIVDPYRITFVALGLGALLAPRDAVKALAWYAVLFMLTIPDWHNPHLDYVVGAAAILGGWPLYTATVVGSIYMLGDNFGLHLAGFRIWNPAQTEIQGDLCWMENCERRPVYEAVTLCLMAAIIWARRPASTSKAWGAWR